MTNAYPDTSPSTPAAEGVARDQHHGFAPDLVILDITLPDLDGFQVLERLRQADPEIPVLMLTGRDGPDDQVHGLERGADDYVVKPFIFETLAARVKAILRRRTIDRPEVLRFADLSLDTGLQRESRGTRDINLTARCSCGGRGLISCSESAA